MALTLESLILAKQLTLFGQAMNRLKGNDHARKTNRHRFASYFGMVPNPGR